MMSVKFNGRCYYSGRELAAHLGVGRNKLYGVLRNTGYLNFHNLPTRKLYEALPAGSIYVDRKDKGPVQVDTVFFDENINIGLLKIGIELEFIRPKERKKAKASNDDFDFMSLIDFD